MLNHTPQVAVTTTSNVTHSIKKHPLFKKGINVLRKRSAFSSLSSALLKVDQKPFSPRLVERSSAPAWPPGSRSVLERVALSR